MIDIHKSARLLNAMGNQKRLEVLRILVQQEIAVSELARLVELSQSALSQHLAKLRTDGFVSTRREAQTVFYSCGSQDVIAMLKDLEGICPSDHREDQQ
ncbi:metalloregulator ArsR/SmtB family transcription factor [Rhizobium pusense]|uniref:ArsR/SmtB family transcription factor n=1 Tax=Agrobacterium pusense TaxID=648995 RepID=UPI000D1A8A2D|nr:metalloregulator ArsR/SmtB family transcription factor [Agrobacterium pusense]MDH0912846.1 metalloregulator ArsR/SmtB family transcription factor [Agrobacterium pusense]MDH1099089.1 metalloregulator ArsR/SmtB family transcription factor [Agrobacterium pusense]MDH1115658.1 metalloregulator ArsR/SmtB family transcription factor [Agrobacterium pusense]MDH2197433.1 metalloregulator ArsR/SmtB family transcription factor [Agrobacterium pusense]